VIKDQIFNEQLRVSSVSKRESKDDKPQRLDRLTILGLVVTAIWTIGFIVSIGWTYNETSTMRPNEWGDLLAGFAAPIAFVWIVIGYFQQREELSLNTRALILQQGELQNQVEETRRLVAESAKQAALSEEANMLSARNLIPLVLREQPEFEVCHVASQARLQIATSLESEISSGADTGTIPSSQTAPVQVRSGYIQLVSVI
jgi:hypothetical protein